MHLLATTTGQIDGSVEPVDLKQSAADVIILSAADSEIALISRAYAAMEDGAPTLRLANLLSLQHNFSVDLYIEKTLQKARLIVIRLLGGQSYWDYGISEIKTLAERRHIKLIVLPGDSTPDPEIIKLSTLPAADCEWLRRYFVAGGQENAENLLRFCFHLLGQAPRPRAASPFASTGMYKAAAKEAAPIVGIIFYRALMEGGQTAPIDDLLEALDEREAGYVAVYVTSLKDKDSATTIQRAFAQRPPDIIINTTSFAVASGQGADPLASYGCPVLQVIFSGATEESWQTSPRGLGVRDLAMNVALPELDGRILSRAISFKTNDFRDARTQCNIATYRSVSDRVSFVADLARNWLALRKTPPAERKIGIVLANYPNKDGRIANGVGYDTPASTVKILKALAEEGYKTGQVPDEGNALLAELMAGPTNAKSSRRSSNIVPLGLYKRYFAALPDSVKRQVLERWGPPEDDPSVLDGCFQIAIKCYDNVAVGIQPARGYNIDPKASYHDPALVPPHAYFAFYFWLRHKFGALAIIHNGKHGNLEWLPGKALSPSAACFPEVALGPLPHVYPFIVNDPGEGTQAKRRASAVIVDHLMPPLTRAETYGALRDLEVLVDEYYLADGMDRRRIDALRSEIIDASKSCRVDIDAGFTGDLDNDLKRLDTYLCDLKEAQIRDGLHILGVSPTGLQETSLLAALVRVPRGLGEGVDQSLHRLLARCVGLDGFDPLDCEVAAPWTGPKPPILQKLNWDPWRTAGDTVERLELLASSLLETLDAGILSDELSGYDEVLALLAHAREKVRKDLRLCGPREICSVLAALDGRSVDPGPSGAPTRGRLDVLPTGRNFYSLDSRSVPTPTAWRLGQASAEELLRRHFQDFGQYPKALGLSAWGTSNMRTGGDDIAQALALIGVKPVWEPSSWRVTGYEIIPLASLRRPRVDVTMRISGFFRDAFPSQIELLDKAMRAVGTLEEDEYDNPVAMRMRLELSELVSAGIPGDVAKEIAGARIFGSKPGAYGAGLQAMIDENIWSERRDLAHAYIAWGSYAYGARLEGQMELQAFTSRLKHIEAVVQNQDNREHDLLDSDDYYQFEGGMSAAVEEASGNRPRVYHNDHSRTEKPVIRTLEEEVGRVVRSRVVNPKWIAGVKRHGYKGAFEIAATIDYMFAFAATTGAVKTHHFDLAYEAFISDRETRDFIAANNPAALKEIAERFQEATERGLWTPRLNSTFTELEELRR